MKTTAETKKERINLRLEASVKKLIERAAGFEGKTVGNFILNSALAQAKKTVHEHEVIALNADNAKSFLDALAAPIRFNTRLASAIEEHSRRVISK